MKISTRTDVSADKGTVFGAITDFDRWERRAMRRGAEVTRGDPATGPGMGSAWDSKFIFRGRRRALQAHVAEFAQDAGMKIESKSGGIEAVFHIELSDVAPGKTRMVTGVELTPSNLSSRILIQSMKLAKGALKKRFAEAMDNLGREIEREAAAKAAASPAGQAAE